MFVDPTLKRKKKKGSRKKDKRRKRNLKYAIISNPFSLQVYIILCRTSSDFLPSLVSLIVWELILKHRSRRISITQSRDSQLKHQPSSDTSSDTCHQLLQPYALFLRFPKKIPLKFISRLSPFFLFLSFFCVCYYIFNSNAEFSFYALPLRLSVISFG